MSYIDRHIEYLLRYNNCVIVPGFGAFINIRHASRFDENSGRWMPVTVEVRFNDAISHDDGLLAASYARKMRISFEEARIILQNDIRSIREALHEDGEITFGRLGILKLQEEGNIFFRQMIDYRKLACELGYVAVPCVSVKKTETILEESFVADVNPSSDNDSELTDSSEMPRKSSKYYYIAINKKLAKIAASVVTLVIIAAVGFIIPAPPKSPLEQQASVVPVETVRTVMSEAVNNVARISDTTTTEIKVAEEVESASPNTSSIDASSTDDYHLIVATFKNEKDADIFISQQNDSSYKLMKIKSKKLCRVSAKASAESGSLYTLLNSPAFRAIYSEAWVWHK